MNEPAGGASTSVEVGSPEPAAARRPWLWPLLAALTAAVPFAGMFSPNRIFHLRDLTLFFWERYLWLRRSLFAGEWPLWDPYVGGGQSAVADGLHQMFLLPSLLVRMLGTEVMGFNLWVALPFPIAALGVFAFFRRRFSAPASALGAIVFAVSGPVVSTGNVPNLSWSIAFMPWVLWAVDRAASSGRGRDAATAAVIAACQVLAGEPVSMAATMVAALVFAFTVRDGRADGVSSTLRSRVGRTALVAASLLLGLATAAIQVLPMATAVADSWRPYSRMTDFWSFHPLALVEVVSPQLLGNYLDATLLAELPWMVAVNSGRDPFFYSVYLGPAALALAMFGAIASPRRRWAWFWVIAAAAALVAAFGAFTPIYPFLQAHVPLVGSFRYPVKYLLVATLAVSALAACGWDGLTGLDGEARRRARAGLASAVGLLALLGLSAAGLFAWISWNQDGAARAFYDLAQSVGAHDPVGCARFALRALPHAATGLASLCVIALTAFVAAARRPGIPRHALVGLVAADLVAAAWGLNPTFDARLAKAPAWTSIVAAHPEARFYVGGRGLDGTFVDTDPDSAKSFVRPFGMSPVEGRSAMAVQSVYAPSPWRVRELLSYDLAVVWPRPLLQAHARFLQAGRDERDRFLSRTATRFRIVQPSSAPGRIPLATLEYFQTLRLYDWGGGLTRAFVVPEQAVVADMNGQIDSLFAANLDASRTVVTGEAARGAFGTPGSPGNPTARIVNESANRVRLDATAGPGGGFLVLLDTFSPDWTAAVDGQPAAILRANALFRTVPLVPGPHRVEFSYRPWSFQVGAAISLAGLMGILLLLRKRV